MSSTCKEGPAPWLRFPQAHTSRVRCFLGRENRLTIQKIAGPERSVLGWDRSSPTENSNAFLQAPVLDSEKERSFSQSLGKTQTSRLQILFLVGAKLRTQTP